ncbi:MAG TPA: phosphotransferase [Actinoplanes sp.]|nr:phosphotransferase [Actinoplanes sp.]
MPDQDLVRSLLRDQWHLTPSEVTELNGALMSQAWEVVAADDRYLVRFVDAAVRQPVEAGLAAAEHLTGWGIAVGTPVRTLAGGLTAAASGGALAVLRRIPGRPLAGGDPVDQQWWGDRLGAVHRALQHFHHPGLRPWNLLSPDAPHLDVEPWLRPAIAEAVTAATRLTVTDRLTYGVLHGDPSPGGFVVDADTGRTGLLDCGASGTGPLIYDVAAAVIYAGGVEAAAELLDGYLAAGPVHQDELDAALPVLLRFRLAVQADWSASRLASCPGAEESLRSARSALEALPG